MKPILCSCDYSTTSAQALKMAYGLSKKLGVQLIILHVFDINLTSAAPLSITHNKIEKKSFEKHREKLMVFCDTHLGVLPDEAHLKILVKENAIVEEAIVATINDFDASMVVMGMKGSGALKELILGSTTKSMLDKSPCPVLVIPSTMTNYDMNIITYATDFEEADIHAIDWLVKTLALPCKSTVNIIHISSKDEYASEDKMQWFKEMLEQKVLYDKISYENIEHNSIFDGLVEHLQKTNSDLVMMLERKHFGFLKWLTTIDKVKLMSSKGKIPLLSFNKKHEQQTSRNIL